MKRALIISCLLVLGVACEKTETKVEKQAEEQKEDVVVVKAPTPYDGTYYFDIETYKSEQLKHNKSAYKNMKPDDLDKMMKIFKPYRIELEGDIGTASFAHDVVKGSITRLSQNTDEMKLRLMPSDKKQTIMTLTIRGDSLILDPGKKESDKMFFKKDK